MESELEIQIQANRQRRLTQEYREIIERGEWPEPWAPRRESPYVSQVDRAGWVDHTNDNLIIPTDNGLWRLSRRNGGDREPFVDAADAMAWLAIQRDIKEAERTREP